MANIRRHGARALTITSHPTARYADRIQLVRWRRGPDNPTFEARVRLSGENAWSKPFSLGTADPTDAAVIAIERLAEREQLRASGLPQPARQPAAEPARAERTFRRAADMVVNDLIGKREEAVRLHGRASGKANTISGHISRIQKTLVPAFGDEPVAAMTNKLVNDWARKHEVAGRRIKGADGKPLPSAERMKAPGQNTVGNWNASMRKVLDRAAKEGWIEADNTPSMSRKGFEASDPRPWLAPHEVERLRDHMTDAWVEAGGGREWEQDVSRDVRYLLRAYVALCSCTGIRPGEEMELIRPNQIIHEKAEDYFRIPVTTYKGRGEPRPRDVILFENDHFDVRRVLLDLLEWRDAKGLPKSAPIFALPKTGACPNFAPPFKRLLEEAGLLIDPETAHKKAPHERVPYSLRHYFATQALLRGVPSDRVALWMGTSQTMIEKTYSKVRLWMLGRSLAGRDASVARLAAAVRRKAGADRQDPNRWHEEEARLAEPGAAE